MNEALVQTLNNIQPSLNLVCSLNELRIEFQFETRMQFTLLLEFHS